MHKLIIKRIDNDEFYKGIINGYQQIVSYCIFLFPRPENRRNSGSHQFISRHASSSKQSAVGTQLTFSFFSPVPALVLCELFFSFLTTFLLFVVVSVLVEGAGEPSVNVYEWRCFQWHFVKLQKKSSKNQIFQSKSASVVLIRILSPHPGFWWSNRKTERPICKTKTLITEAGADLHIFFYTKQCSEILVSPNTALMSNIWISVPRNMAPLPRFNLTRAKMAFFKHLFTDHEPKMWLQRY